MSEQPTLPVIKKPDLTIKKRSVLVEGHATSVSMEQIFWDHLSIMAERRNKSINKLVSHIDKARKGKGNLSSAIRVFIVQDLAAAAAKVENH